jgi:hypothetical protein
VSDGVEAGRDCLREALVDGVDRVAPRAHVERAELGAVGGDAWMR